ncbi:MAG: PilZ domain-containing protein [Planctomycetota bacterium]
MLGEELQETLNVLQSEIASASEDGSETPQRRSVDDFLSPRLEKDEKRETSDRSQENISVALRPSSYSQRALEFIEGTCRNLSQSGCGIVSSSAPRVGDIYHIEVPANQSHRLQGMDARCVRCHLLDAEAFDCGFTFLAPLPADNGRSNSSSEPLV